jgi:hypothetical protein
MQQLLILRLNRKNLTTFKSKKTEKYLKKFRKLQMRLRISVINIFKILRTYKKLWPSRGLRSLNINMLLRIAKE